MVFDHFIEHAAVTQDNCLIVGDAFQVNGATTLHFWENAETMKTAYCKLFKISKKKFEDGDALFKTIDYFLVLYSKPFLKLLSEPDYSLAENNWKSIEAIITSEKEKRPNHNWANLYHALINLVSLIGSIFHQLDDAQKKNLSNIEEQLHEKGAAPFTVPLLFCGVNTAMKEAIAFFHLEDMIELSIQDIDHAYRSDSSSFAKKTAVSAVATAGAIALNPVFGLSFLGGACVATLKNGKNNRNQYKLLFQHCYWYMILLSCYSRYYYDANSSAQA